MATPAQYRHFARECLKWATEADSDELRDSFLRMARDWEAAALAADGIGLERIETEPPHGEKRAP
jgi:hypothetical protein